MYFKSSTVYICIEEFYVLPLISVSVTPLVGSVLCHPCARTLAKATFNVTSNVVH